MTNRNWEVNPLTDREKGSSIQHAIEVKAAFEMYAYHIIDHKTFAIRMYELSKATLSEFSKYSLDEKGE